MDVEPSNDSNVGTKRRVCLPLELIIEILSRLPVKFLLKFRCACKQWLSLISSPLFIKAHINASTKFKTYVNSFLILKLSKSFYSNTYFTCSISSLLDDTASIIIPRDLDVPIEDQGFKIIGTCNGLLSGLIYPDKTHFLYNPCIRKLNKLPDNGKKYNLLHISYGFCYDEFNDDYKLVDLSTVFPCYTYIEIYSLRANSWRRINDYKRGSFYRSGVAVGGVLYWIVGIGLSQIILLVDTVNYTSRTLALPKYEDFGSVERYFGILDFGGLGVYHEYDKIRMDIWTMKESWMKVLSVPYCVNPIRRHIQPILGLEDVNVFFRKHIQPILGLKDGEVLLYKEKYLMVYNSKKNSFINHQIGEINGRIPWLQSTLFIESLVAPNYEGG
ncbi:hypothetical protein LIER_11315 [Lithospermum erythrorhizon]|uniref:F-box domain-containing protein n=1 Tax=Lithospermum erythrorhizon TaxID=34254 RepID=A0AAV3PNU0_LITER